MKKILILCSLIVSLFIPFAAKAVDTEVITNVSVTPGKIAPNSTEITVKYEITNLARLQEAKDYEGIAIVFSPRLGGSDLHTAFFPASEFQSAGAYSYTWKIDKPLYVGFYSAKVGFGSNPSEFGYIDFGYDNSREFEVMTQADYDELVAAGQTAPDVTPAPTVDPNRPRYVQAGQESVTDLKIDGAAVNIVGSKINISFEALVSTPSSLYYTVRDVNNKVMIDSYFPVNWCGNHTFAWDLLDSSQKRVPDGKYTLELKLTNYDGDVVIMPSKLFEIFLGKAPKMEEASISSTTGTLAYAGAPVVSVKFSTQADCYVTVFNDKDKEIDSFSVAVEAGKVGRIQWDLHDVNKKLVGVGSYKIKVVGKNKFGTTESSEATFSIQKAPALTAELKATNNKIMLNPWTKASFSLALNQYCEVIIRYYNADNKLVGYIGEKQIAKNGTFDLLSKTGNKYLTAGKYKVEVSAVSLTGEKKTVNTQVAFSKPPAVSISNAKLSVSTVEAGGACVFTGKASTDAEITGTLFLNGKAIRSVMQNATTNIKLNVDTSGLAAGKYTLTVYAENGAGVSKVSKELTVKAAMTLTGLDSYSTNQYEIITVDYSGKGTIELKIYSPENKVVYQETKAVSGSGSWTLKWDYCYMNGDYVDDGTYKIAVVMTNSSKATSNTLTHSFRVVY